MRIEVTRTGGFAGIERHAGIDTDDLPDTADPAGWRELAGRVVTGAGAVPPRGVPDGFGYEITVDGRTVYCAEPDISDDQRELISRVLRTGA
ncbi:protealysin inhibitor emfourin [Streptomyces yaizuensis]|uniref:Chorismate synthase n=1 Tax=Streptomyces yaizuensis TaxID=2989713 RepID=A0ABQ5NUG3_9ACTN|nr:protealysin inhibitor emfourin [Streptomyces sp. YSPA8]GLF93788.1 chorismate synthase [Streptomyces sp. YSPA8]